MRTMLAGFAAAYHCWGGSPRWCAHSPSAAPPSILDTDGGVVHPGVRRLVLDAVSKREHLDAGRQRHDIDASEGGLLVLLVDLALLILVGGADDLVRKTLTVGGIVMCHSSPS